MQFLFPLTGGNWTVQLAVAQNLANVTDRLTDGRRKTRYRTICDTPLPFAQRPLEVVHWRCLSSSCIQTDASIPPTPTIYELFWATSCMNPRGAIRRRIWMQFECKHRRCHTRARTCDVIFIRIIHISHVSVHADVTVVIVIRAVEFRRGRW